MYATIRTYSDPELADQIAARSDEVERLISGVQGLRGYYLIKTEEGCATVTVCDDEAGTRESVRVAADWLREHASEVKSTPPQISGGEVLVQVGSTANV